MPFFPYVCTESCCSFPLYRRPATLCKQTHLSTCIHVDPPLAKMARQSGLSKENAGEKEYCCLGSYLGDHILLQSVFQFISS